MIFKSAIDVVRQLLFLVRDVQQCKSDIAAFRNQLQETNETLKLLAFEVRLLQEREKNERERLELRLENALLRFEKTIEAGPRKRKRSR